MSGEGGPMGLFVEDMITAIGKKDSDAIIHSIDDGTGEIDIETSIDLANNDFCQVVEDDAPPLIDSQMLRDDASGINGDIHIRIIYTVFSVLAVIHFIAIATGILVYFVLLYDETKLVAIVVASVSSTLLAVFYVLVAWQRDSELGPIFGVGFMTVRIFVIAALSRLIENEILYMLEMVYLYQTAFLIIYTTKRPYQDVDDQLDVQCWDLRVLHSIRESRYTRTAFNWLLATSSVVWIAGIVLFIRVLERNLMWLWATLSYPLVVLACIYKCRFVGNMVLRDARRYSLTQGDRKRAVLEYYVDPLMSVWNKLMQI